MFVNGCQQGRRRINGRVKSGLPVTENLILHLLASEGVFSDGGSTPAQDTDTVQEWHDQSGSNNDFSQTTAPKKPVLRTVIVNGHSVLRLDGTDDLMTAANFSSATQGTLFVVYNLSVLNSASTLFSSADEATTDHRWLLSGYRNGPDPYAYVLTEQATAIDLAQGETTTILVSTWYVICLRSDGATWEMWINGTSQTLVAGPGTNSGEWFGDVSNRDSTVIGALKDSSEGSFFEGDIAEIVGYSVSLSDTDRQSVEDYLLDKYAIS